MQIDIEKLSNSPYALEVLQNRFTPLMKPERDNSILWLDLDGYRVELMGKGEILPIQGKSGVGKSILIELIVGACLSGGAGIFKSRGIKSILYIDTEQSKNQWLQANHRILKYAKRKDAGGGFLSVHLKRFPTGVRTSIIDDLINATEQVDLIVIDGLADLLSSYNNEELAISMMDKVQEWIDTKDAGFITVLHENKSKDSDSMKGHIGTMVLQKCTTAISVSKPPESPVMEIKAVKTRGRHWKPQSFFVNNLKMVEIGESESGVKIPGDRVYKKESENRNSTLNDLLNTV